MLLYILCATEKVVDIMSDDHDYTLVTSLIKILHHTETEITLLSMLQVLKAENPALFTKILNKTIYNIENETPLFKQISNVPEEFLKDEIENNLKKYANFLKEQIK